MLVGAHPPELLHPFSSSLILRQVDRWKSDRKGVVECGNIRWALSGPPVWVCKHHLCHKQTLQTCAKQANKSAKITGAAEGWFVEFISAFDKPCWGQQLNKMR